MTSLVPSAVSLEPISQFDLSGQYAAIGSTIYYPVPLHLQPLYAGLGHKAGDFPNAEHVANEILSLPMYPELTSDKIERVATTIAEFARQ